MAFTGVSAHGLKVSPSQTTAFTATSKYGVWLCSGTFTVTLPAAADAHVNGFGGVLTFKNTGTGVITLDGASAETIDGVATKALNALESITIVSDDSGWHTIPNAVGNVANNNVAAGALVTHVVTVPDAATGNVDVTIQDKFEVLDVHLIKTGGAGGASDTIQVLNAANAITNALDINVADKVVVRAGTIDDAYSAIAAGGTLRVTRTKSSGANTACLVVVTGIRRS